MNALIENAFKQHEEMANKENFKVQRICEGMREGLNTTTSSSKFQFPYDQFINIKGVRNVLLILEKLVKVKTDNYYIFLTFVPRRVQRLSEWKKGVTHLDENGLKFFACLKECAWRVVATAIDQVVKALSTKRGKVELELESNFAWLEKTFTREGYVTRFEIKKSKYDVTYLLTIQTYSESVLGPVCKSIREYAHDFSDMTLVDDFSLKAFMKLDFVSALKGRLEGLVEISDITGVREGRTEIKFVAPLEEIQKLERGDYFFADDCDEFIRALIYAAERCIGRDRSECTKVYVRIN
jgi:beta-galactosidase beta subunit